MIYERKNINNWSNFIKEGNIAKIRQWDDMEKEYELDCDGLIKCQCAFTDVMKGLCGEEVKITKTMEDDYKGRGYFMFFGYFISTDMIESINDNEKKYEVTVILDYKYI